MTDLIRALIIKNLLSSSDEMNGGMTIEDIEYTDMIIEYLSKVNKGILAFIDALGKSKDIRNTYDILKLLFSRSNMIRDIKIAMMTSDGMMSIESIQEKMNASMDVLDNIHISKESADREFYMMSDIKDEYMKLNSYILIMLNKLNNM